MTEVSECISLERYKNLFTWARWLHNTLGIASSYTLKHQIGTPLITTWLNFVYEAQVCKNMFFFSFSLSLCRKTAKSGCFYLVYNLCWCELLPLVGQTPKLYSRCCCAVRLRTAALIATQQQEPKCPLWTGASPAPILLSFSMLHFSALGITKANSCLQDLSYFSQNPFNFL